MNDSDGNVIYQGKITGLPLKDELIVSKSILFFNDPSPCFIHRSAVMNRLFAELEEYLENKCVGAYSCLVPAEMPQAIQEILPFERIASLRYV